MILLDMIFNCWEFGLREIYVVVNKYGEIFFDKWVLNCFRFWLIGILCIVVYRLIDWLECDFLVSNFVIDVGYIENVCIFKSKIN